MTTKKDFAQQAEEARRELHGWTPERREAVKLEGAINGPDDNRGPKRNAQLQPSKDQKRAK